MAYAAVQGTKCHRSAKNASPILELATPKKQLTDSQGELRDAYQDSRSALKDLLLHTVGHYEAKTPAGTKVLFAARYDISSDYLADSMVLHPACHAVNFSCLI